MILGHLHSQISISGVHFGDVSSLQQNRQITAEDIGMDDDEVLAIRGDADAEVRAEVGVADKDFGNGYHATVSVTLMCSQTEEGVQGALEIAESLALEGLKEVNAAAKAFYKEVS